MLSPASAQVTINGDAAPSDPALIDGDDDLQDLCRDINENALAGIFHQHGIEFLDIIQIIGNSRHQLINQKRHTDNHQHKRQKLQQGYYFLFLFKIHFFFLHQRLCFAAHNTTK